MKSPILGLLAFALIGVGGYARAQTLVGTTTDPTGIDGLVIDGTTYNVTFSTTSPSQSPFEQGTAASYGAAIAMAGALSSLGVTALAGVSPPADCPPDNHVCQTNAVLFVAVDGGQGLMNDVATCLGDTGPAPTPCSQHSWSADQIFQPPGLGYLGTGYGYLANFTAAPEPATLGLMLLGLAGIGLASRKPKH